MKKLASAVLTVVLLAIPALAEPASKPSPPPAKQITVAEALSLLAGLRNLDGHVVVVKQNGQDVTVIQPWDFGSGVLRLHIAWDLDILSKVETAANKSHDTIIREILDKMPAGKDGARPTSIPQGTQQFDDLQKQWQAVLDQPAEGAEHLLKIKASELKLDKNEIPVTALAALTPILVDDVTAGK